MRVIEPSAEILKPALTKDAINAIYQAIETAGRTCYKSENLITPESSRKFVANLVKNKHEAMLEHASMTVRFIVDRGVSHELVRHRIASFAQESQRYCNYGKEKFGNEITFIRPYYFSDGYGPYAYKLWETACESAEQAYLLMTQQLKIPPECARTVLPNSTKTEVIITANMREWRTIFKLRAAGETGKPHPQMSQVMIPLLKRCQDLMPELFGDIGVGE